MRRLTAIGAMLAFVGVAMGAFGAHALRDRIGPAALSTYHTGVEYHLTHALAILLLASLAGGTVNEKRAETVGILFALGILLFSGSLYLLAVTGVRILGAITPFGGICFLVGWAMLAYSARSASR